MILPLSLTSTCADIFADDTTIGTSSHFVDTLVETVTTDLQHVLSWCNHDIQVSSIEILAVPISNTLCWDAHIDHLIKKCNSYVFLLSRINVFYLEGTEYCFTTLPFDLLLISVVLSGVNVVPHWTINL